MPRNVGKWASLNVSYYWVIILNKMDGLRNIKSRLFNSCAAIKVTIVLVIGQGHKTRVKVIEA